jgi:rifampin ADP-ribosylating transferase
VDQRRIPTWSYRSREPLRIVGELTDRTRLTPAAPKAWHDRLAAQANERGEIID